MKHFLSLFALIFMLAPVFADEPLLSSEENTEYFDSGEFRVVLYGGGLIPLDYAKNDTLFVVYKNGALYDTQRVRDVIKNLKKLQRTVSHYKWGTLLDVYSDGIFFDTVEGLKRYDFAKKSFVKTTKEERRAFAE